MKKPTKKILNSIDMSKILEFIPKEDTNLQYIDMEAGKEHYRLLTWISGQVKGKIMELGTFRGHSAVCLANQGRHVLSFDVEQCRSLNFHPQGVDFYIDSHGFERITDDFELLFIDTMHDGYYERLVLDHLRLIKWKGIVIMDDIVIFPELAKLWDEIPERRADWTDIGHYSGTGIIWFE